MLTYRLPLRLFALVLALLPLAAHAQPAARFSLADLGPVPANVPLALNNRGQVVFANVLWKNGRRTTLGRGFTARSINDAGWVAGTIPTGRKDARGEPIRHAALWRAGRITDLTPADPTRPSEAVAVNGPGQVLISDADALRVCLLIQRGDPDRVVGVRRVGVAHGLGRGRAQPVPVDVAHG